MAAIENVRRTKFVVLAMRAGCQPLCLLPKCRAMDSRPPRSRLQAILVSGDRQRMSIGECGRHRPVQAVPGALRLRGSVERAGNLRDLGLSGLVARDSPNAYQEAAMASFAPAFTLAIVGAGRRRGQISMSCCPGRAAPWLVPSVAQRELERDIATIARWGSEALVTLLDEVELARLHLHKLSSLLATAKLAWYHVPLACDILPDAEFDRGWNSVSLRLQHILREGGKVSIHCRDGSERTGFITARLLIELGCHPLDAMNRVRAARPGTLQSAKLTDYLRCMQVSGLEAVTRLESLNHHGSGAARPRAIHIKAPAVTRDRFRKHRIVVDTGYPART